MKKPAPRLYRSKTPSPSPRSGSKRRATGAGPIALQLRADHSTAVAQLFRLQGRADSLLQREVDDRNITQNGSYDAQGNLANGKNVGVPGWAETQYREDHRPVIDTSPITHNGTYDARGNAPADKSNSLALWAVHDFLLDETTMIASMTDGKIGSIYFPGGRVRTTHGAGPEVDTHPQSRTLQFNIDADACWQAFVQASPWLDRVDPNNPEHMETVRRRLKRFRINALKGVAPDQLPAWAQPITTPADALPEGTNTDNTGIKLFEIMLKENGSVHSTHPSRGAAVQVKITRSDLVKLKAIAKLTEDIPDVFTRNDMFYNYVVRKLPHLKDLIRKPDEVNY